MVDREALLARWKKASPSPPRAEEVYRLLEEKYKAYRLPLNYMEPDGLDQDEEIRAELLDSLFTITNPLVLNQIAGPLDTFEEDIEVWPGIFESKEERAELTDTYWRSLFSSPSEELEYSILLAQHFSGHRVSLVLEREGDRITGYKVYGRRGQGSSLDRYLQGWIGFPTRRPQDPEDGPFMKPGDIEDPVFLQYLQAAAEAEII